MTSSENQHDERITKGQTVVIGWYHRYFIALLGEFTIEYDNQLN